MKIKLIASTLLALACTAFAGTNTITGTLDIKFNSRLQPEKENVSDVYTLNLNVCDSALFYGTVSARPFIKGIINDQQGLLTYDLKTDVVNPKNPAQTKNIGKLYGTAPVDANNVYRFENGNVQVNIFPMGSAKGFDSKFKGLALGKPPVKKGFLAAAKESLNFSKSVKGKTVVIKVNNYDIMEFQNLQVAAGPVQVYGEATVSGRMVYDYSRSAWYFQNMSVNYFVDGKLLRDSITGNIRWNDTTGEYQFDVRVNEPPANEAAAFDTGASDESAFFDMDTSIPALVGTMKYTDSKTGGTVSASAIKIDLTGNQLNKQQIMYLSKLILLSAIVPLNAE